MDNSDEFVAAFLRQQIDYGSHRQGKRVNIRTRDDCSWKVEVQRLRRVGCGLKFTRHSHWE